MQQLSYQCVFVGEVSEESDSSPEKTDEPFHYAYSYLRKDYPEWSERRVNSPLPPVALPGLSENDVKPVYPIWLGSDGELRDESHVELPAGYKPTLPKNLDLSETFAEYHRSFEFKGNILTAHRRVIVKLREVPGAE